MSTWSFIPRDNEIGREADHLPAPRAKIRVSVEQCLYPFTPPSYAFITRTQRNMLLSVHTNQVNIITLKHCMKNVIGLDASYSNIRNTHITYHFIF
jgi:hypothetical protein